MAGPTGRGHCLGAALNDLLRSQVTPRHRLSSYNAKHWHAQLGQLTATHRGQQALEDAGLHVTTKTLINWLSDSEYNIRRSYRDLIHTAYENVAVVPSDPLPDHISGASTRSAASSRPATTNANAATGGPLLSALTAAGATGTPSRNPGSPASSPTTTSKTTSSTTSSSRTSAKAPTAGSSPAPRTPSRSGSTRLRGRMAGDIETVLRLGAS
ncbi:hypothetical protein GCM10010104_24690 [Streptomyces indiaensis]|uniref:Uncharacterized protein n=1 Tax=Streptomyces indiaensis TaxID=284033 RepID=A0ABN3DG44_9ACTN